MWSDVDVAALAAAQVEHAKLLGGGVRFSFRPGPAGPAVIRADADRLGQVVTKLLDNARQVTPPGRRVGGDASAVTVTVTDTGIPPDRREQVSDRFVRLDRGGPGSGLGWRSPGRWRRRTAAR